MADHPGIRTTIRIQVLPGPTGSMVSTDIRPAPVRRATATPSSSETASTSTASLWLGSTAKYSPTGTSLPEPPARSVADGGSPTARTGAGSTVTRIVCVAEPAGVVREAVTVVCPSLTGVTTTTAIRPLPTTWAVATVSCSDRTSVRASLCWPNPTTKRSLTGTWAGGPPSIRMSGAGSPATPGGSGGGAGGGGAGRGADGVPA